MLIFKLNHLANVCIYFDLLSEYFYNEKVGIIVMLSMSLFDTLHDVKIGYISS